MSLVGYSDSESEYEINETFDKEEPRKKRKINALPLTILNKFSKVPLKINTSITKENIINEKLETTFAYIPILINEESKLIIENIINDVKIKLRDINDNNNSNNKLLIKKLYYNELTDSTNTLHISLSYNLTMRKLEMDNMIKNITNDYLLKSIKLPIPLKFINKVQLFPNIEKNKYFIGLLLNDENISQLQPFVQCFNKYNSSHIYDPKKLHISLATIEVDNNKKMLETNTIEIPLQTIKLIKVQASSIEISRGRSILTLFPH